MYNVPIDEDRVHSLVVEVLMDWYEDAEPQDQKYIAKTIKFGSTPEEYKRWKASTGS